ncbi:class I SAM-dependent methyltransferase [Paenibacillus taiwanensis]|uniref:class I SAM-dependent methyltransferase n=1 Tax=Paenibacillus taiwanensis TaxID=401638 RepID=UPI00041EF1E7|nr:class I SAM-dependent methyltransferase [Paenibacillus taiwanensis]
MPAWYEQSFGEDYLLVYKHRDMQGAAEEVHRMVNWLQLPQGAHIFDLCCGMGRHSVALAEAGYQVTGMDLSEVLLREARIHDGTGSVTFVRGDMRRVPLEGPFDAVVNLFTSFGYFEEDADNAQVIHEIARVLRTGCPFIIDFLNAAYVEQHLVRQSERIDANTLIQETRKIEDGYVKKNITLTSITQHNQQSLEENTRHYEERVKLYGLPAFRRMIADAGLVLDHVYGDYDGSEYDAERSTRLILVGRKL